MSVKLSELLEIAIESWQNWIGLCYQRGDYYGLKQAENDMRALRAIAPALVDAVNGVFEHRRKVADEPEHLHRTDVCEACKFAITLESAGVTCD